MIALRFNNRVFVLITLLTIWKFSLAARAEQPPAVSPAPAELKNAPPRLKPQVIYHLPRTPAYAAALHSQAKAPSNALPIDSGMPTSLQISRAAANAAAAQAQESSSSPGDAKKNADSAEAAQEHAVKRRPQSNRSRSVLRVRPAPKTHGPGSSPGNKSHRK